MVVSQASNQTLEYSMEQISTTQRYTGRTQTRKVLARTRCTITVERKDWQTGKMVLRLQPSTGIYSDAYSGEQYREQSSN